MTQMLEPQQAIRLLRAKATILETRALDEVHAHGLPMRPVTELATDVALVATLLADLMERLDGNL